MSRPRELLLRSFLKRRTATTLFTAPRLTFRTTTDHIQPVLYAFTDRLF